MGENQQECITSKEGEKKCATKELEMLAFVWGSDVFQNFVLGRKILILTDHEALVSLLNGNNKKKKTTLSRLKLWLDCFIPFGFLVEHKTGAKIGLSACLTRHPTSYGQHMG